MDKPIWAVAFGRDIFELLMQFYMFLHCTEKLVA